MRPFLLGLLIIVALHRTTAFCVCDRCDCVPGHCEPKGKCMVPQTGFDDIVEVSDGKFVYSFQSIGILSQENAHEECKGQGFDGLLSIDSEEQRKFIHGVLKHSRVRYNFWTSMRKHGGAFMWQPSGSNFTELWWWFPNDTDKDENCVALKSRAALLQPIRCQFSQHWVCQAKVCA